MERVLNTSLLSIHHYFPNCKTLASAMNLYFDCGDKFVGIDTFCWGIAVKIILNFKLILRYFITLHKRLSPISKPKFAVLKQLNAICHQTFMKYFHCQRTKVQLFSTPLYNTTKNVVEVSLWHFKTFLMNWQRV